MEIASNAELISKFLTCSSHNSPIPLSRGSTALAINTQCAIGAVEEEKKKRKKGEKCPAVLQPHCKGLLQKCIFSGPAGYPKGNQFYL